MFWYLMIVLIFYVAPVVILVALILKYVDSPKNLRRLLAALAALALIVVGIEITAYIYRENAVRNMYARIPQAIEIFEQSREQFDLLVNSELAVNAGASGAEVRRQVNRWVVRYRFRSAPLERGYTIGLCNDSIKSLTYLVSSEELEYNFRLITARSSPAVNIRAELFRRGGARMVISYGQPIQGSHVHSFIDLGDGYTLSLIKPPAGPSETSAFLLVVILFCTVATAMKLALVWEDEKQKAKLNSSPEE